MASYLFFGKVKLSTKSKEEKCLSTQLNKTKQFSRLHFSNFSCLFYLCRISKVWNRWYIATTTRRIGPSSFVALVDIEVEVEFDCPPPLSEDAVAHVAWNAGAVGHGIVQGFPG